MADGDTRTDEEKKAAEHRMTDPGIYMIGDKVIWDGEAKTLGVAPKTTMALPPGLEDAGEATDDE